MTFGSAIAGSAPSTRPSSIGLSLQAQPAPWLYSVSRSGESSFIACLVWPCKSPRPLRPASPSTSPASGEDNLLLWLLSLLRFLLTVGLPSKRLSRLRDAGLGARASRGWVGSG